MKKTALLLLVAALLLSPTVINAQDTTQDEVVATPTARPGRPLERQAEIRQKTQERLLEQKQFIQQRRESVATQIQERKDAFKERLSQVRDQQKKVILQRIEGNLERLNKNMVAHFQKLLTRFTKLLEKLDTRADKMSQNGVNVGQYEAKKVEIDTAVDELTQLLATQATKSYTPDASSSAVASAEAGLKIGAGQAYQALQADLKVIRDKFKAVHQDFKDALRLLKSAQQETKVSTPSADTDSEVSTDSAQ